jgi:hypothetical protein
MTSTAQIVRAIRYDLNAARDVDQIALFELAPPVDIDVRDLRTGDVLAPGSFGIKSPKRILIVAGAEPLDAGRVEITFRVGDHGPPVTGALNEEGTITVIEPRRNTYPGLG